MSKTTRNYNNFDNNEQINNDRINNNTNKQKNKKRKKNKYYRNRNKSEEKKNKVLNKSGFEILKEIEIEDNNENNTIITFNFDKSPIKTCFDKNKEFPSFENFDNMKKIFYEKHIKKFIEDSDKLQNYILLKKSNNIKNVDYNSLMKDFEQNKENIKIGINNYLRKANEIILYKYEFDFDKVNTNELNIFVDDKNDINTDYFSKNNSIFKAYQKKNIKSINISSKEDIQKSNNEINGDIFGNITKINHRWLNKQKCTKKINEPKIDNYKIHYNIWNTLELPVIEQVFQEYAMQKIRTMQLDINYINKPNFDFGSDDIITEIFIPFKEDNTKVNKIVLDTDVFISDSLEEINNIYNTKYYLNMTILSQNVTKCDIDVLGDINLNDNYEKFKEWKNELKIKKNKYICSGNASIELMKSTLVNNSYNNPKTSLLHNLSLKLNEIDNKNSHDNINLTIHKSADFYLSNLGLNKSNNSISAQKLQEEIKLSLNNINTYSSKFLALNKNKSEVLRCKKKFSSLNSGIRENDIKGEYDCNMMMKQMKAAEKKIERKSRKILNNKIKIQNEKNMEKEINRENKYRMLTTLFMTALPLIYFAYKNLWSFE